MVWAHIQEPHWILNMILGLQLDILTCYIHSLVFIVNAMSQFFTILCADTHKWGYEIFLRFSTSQEHGMHLPFFLICCKIS